MSEMALHWPFAHLQPKLWAKEGPGVKLAIWLSTTKSRESTSSRHPNLECSRRGLQVWLRPRPDWRRGEKLWCPKVLAVQTGTVSGIHFGSPGKKCHSSASAAEWHRVYYREDGGDTSRVWAVMNLVVQSARGLSQHPRVFPNVN
jgi:hypothetical protein